MQNFMPPRIAEVFGKQLLAIQALVRLILPHSCLRCSLSSSPFSDGLSSTLAFTS